MTNALQRLLDPTTRECLRGHGPMDKQPGIWVLQQVERAGLINMGALTLTGQLLTSHVFVCPRCGFVELVDEGRA